MRPSAFGTGIPILPLLHYVSDIDILPDAISRVDWADDVRRGAADPTEGHAQEAHKGVRSRDLPHFSDPVSPGLRRD